MTLWRLHTRPRGGTITDPAIVFKYCEDNGVLGVGWGVVRPAKSFADYKKQWEKSYGGMGGGLSAVQALDQMRGGDLVWTRDTAGTYYLGKVRGNDPEASVLRYDASKDAIDHDIVNVVPVELKRIGWDGTVTRKVPTGEVTDSIARCPQFHTPATSSLPPTSSMRFGCISGSH